MALQPKHKARAKVALASLGAGLVLGTISTAADTPTQVKGAEEVQRYLEAASEVADLAAIGQNPDLMYQTPVFGPYPGARVVWEDLKQPTAASTA